MQHLNWHFNYWCYVSSYIRNKYLVDGVEGFSSWYLDPDSFSNLAEEAILFGAGSSNQTLSTILGSNEILELKTDKRHQEENQGIYGLYGW